MKNKSTITFLFLLLTCNVFLAQKWVDDMQKPDANLYEIQAGFEQYWSTRDRTEKGKGYKAFRRWENFAAPRVYPSGNLSQLNQTGPNFEKFMSSQQAPGGPGKPLGSSNNLIASSTWTAMGPFGPLSGTASGQLLKSGRLNFITIETTNTLSLWVGAPAGGLWHSTNGGTSWTTNTDQLSVIGCSDLVVDPTNSSVLYLATGDGDAGDTRSIGVLKSTNGGATWNTTGLTSPVTTNFLIRKLLIHPTNNQILFAATTNGVYRTTNGGTNWTVVSANNTFDIEFKPGDPNTVYAAGTIFRVSTNGGTSFSTIALPSTAIQRLAIGVTPNDPNYVYLLAADNASSGFLALYRSTNSGTSFSTMSNSSSINVLGWSNVGTDTGGQGWYDLCMAVSPLNKDEVVVGGVNVWRSLNGGANWSIYGHWTGSSAPFIHADQHDLEYAADGTLFGTNDGTVYRRTSTTWQEICGQMNISQIYKLGLSGITASKWITGHQDNGTSIYTTGTYAARIGGDGMDCFIDRTNDGNVFGETYNGDFRRSTNGGVNWTSCIGGLSGTAPWVTAWKQDPQTSTTLYGGLTNLFKATNLAATSWTMLTALPAGGTINEFAIAPSNNQIIYVLKNSGIYKTTNGGTSWSTVTNGVPVGSAAPQFISIDPTDPNNAWVVLSGYSAGNKVYMTTNGGTSWTNYSANLPNLPTNCCVYEPGSSDMIYVGMDVGVYYRNSSASQWTLYNGGLPNVPISDMEISPANPGILYAATYGRGVWAVSLYATTAAPQTTFNIPANGRCAGATMTFSDQSLNSPTTWNWSVLPSGGVSINSPNVSNPVITFPAAGNYTVSLQVGNSIGQGSVNTQVVTIYNFPSVNISTPSQTVCAGEAVVLSGSGANSYTWSGSGGNNQTAVFYPSSASVYSLSGTSNGCTSVSSITVFGMSPPTVGISGQNLSCAGEAVVLVGTGAQSYTWSNSMTGTSTTVTPLVTTVYSVVGADAFGCESTAFLVLGVNPLPSIGIIGSNTMVCLEEEVVLTATASAGNFSWTPVAQTSATLSVNPSITTTYFCTTTDNNGCTNSSAFTVSVSTCESIVQVKSAPEKNFSVFPNPVKNKITIRTQDLNISGITIEIIDLSGRVVLRQAADFHGGLTTEINTGSLVSGSYIIKLTSKNNSTEVVRILKE